MNKHLKTSVATALASLAFCATQNVAASTITLTPASPQATGSIKANSTTGAPGFGGSSFQEKSGSKSEIYIDPSSLFTAPVTFGSIASISYWTNKTPGSSTVASTSPDVDWSLYLYTFKTGDHDTGTFYHSRLTAEPLYSNGSYVGGAWHQWSTNDASAPLRFYDTARDGGIQGTNTDPTLSDLQNGGGAYQFTGANAGPAATGANNYNNELIEYFSLQTGSAWSQGFTGLVDGLTITLKDGEVARVDLSDGITAAAVPEPESMALLFIGMAGLLAVSRRRFAARA